MQYPSLDDQEILINELQVPLKSLTSDYHVSEKEREVCYEIPLVNKDNYKFHAVSVNLTNNVNILLQEKESGNVEIYDLNGRKIVDGSTIEKGIYIVKEGGHLKKVAI